jgi:DNA-directed RNA polymerase-3 subunit RPC5
MELAGSNVDPKHYFNTLVPAEDKETLSALGSCTPLPDLKDLPLQDAVKTLMMSAGVLRFRTVCSLVEGVSTQQRGVPTQLEEEVLSHLMKVAVLVQGCWVLRSSLFYTEDYHSLYNSVPYTVMCVARDLILLKFALTCQAIVTREEITKQVSIPQEELVEILSSLGRQREGLGWEFRMDMDKEFLSQHSNVVAKQLEWWKTQREKLQSSASQPKEDPTELTKPKALGKKKRPSYGRPNSKEEPSPTACVGVKSEPLPPTPHSEDIVSSLSEWVSKSVGPGVIPLHELRQSLDHHLLSSSSNNDLHSLTGDEEAFVRGLQSAGMCEVDIKDVGMDGDGKPVRLFTRTQVGNDSDRYRCHILEMFKELSSVRKKQVCEEIKRKTGEDPNIKLVTAVLKDLCYSKGALWHLFGT